MDMMMIVSSAMALIFGSFITEFEIRTLFANLDGPVSLHVFILLRIEVSR